jgi:phage/plasmid-associated DNA primase
VRFAYKPPFTAAPHHVLMLVSNHTPQLDAGDAALRTRILAIPFHIPLLSGGRLELTGGTHLETVRRDPASPLVRGFAAWALAGLEQLYTEQEIYRAPCIEAATKSFWSECDPISQFWETVPQRDLENGFKKAHLRERYVEWCRQEGAQPVGYIFWSRACRARGLQECRHNEFRYWVLIDESIVKARALSEADLS